MTQITARVHGRPGHRQRESFFRSMVYQYDDFTLVERNSDITGTNEYTGLVITAADEDTCRQILEGQVSDGIFESCGTGTIEIVSIKEV